MVNFKKEIFSSKTGLSPPPQKGGGKGGRRVSFLFLFLPDLDPSCQRHDIKPCIEGLGCRVLSCCNSSRMEPRRRRRRGRKREIGNLCYLVGRGAAMFVGLLRRGGGGYSGLGKHCWKESLCSQQSRVVTAALGFYSGM
jgi:hypothetical protein